MTMVCDNCGRAGIRWVGPLTHLTHTECPHCGGTNCQRAEADDEDASEACPSCLEPLTEDYACVRCSDDAGGAS